jgi:hypothetical protein
MPSISGLNAWLSCTFAPDTATASGQAVGLGQHVQLAALLAPIDQIRPGQRALFFARTDAASTIADDQPGGQFDAVGQGYAHVDALNHGGHSFIGSLLMRRDVTAAQI